MLLNATTRKDVDGQVVGVIGVGQDITERKHVEVEKTRVAQELQTFIDTANAPIFGIDARGLVNEWNNKAAAITGFSRSEVLGKNLVQARINLSEAYQCTEWSKSSGPDLSPCHSVVRTQPRVHLGGAEAGIPALDSFVTLNLCRARPPQYVKEAVLRPPCSNAIPIPSLDAISENSGAAQCAFP